MDRLERLMFTKSKFHNLSKIPSISFLPPLGHAASMCYINIKFADKIIKITKLLIFLNLALYLI